MNLGDLETAANAVNLSVFGVSGSVVLLGPHEPGFWPMFTNSAEWCDGRPDPVDRWSARVIGGLAEQFGAVPHFPFGSPTAPFLTWAMNSDAAWQSPVGMLVHDTAGLLVSYRGALEFDKPIALIPRVKPCNDCAMPCVTACPIGALSSSGYDVPKCQTFLNTDAGSDCLNNGCAVRRSCPVSQTYGRLPEQSAYHMQRFLK